MIVHGPAGVGKTALVKAILKHSPYAVVGPRDCLHKPVTDKTVTRKTVGTTVLVKAILTHSPYAMVGPL